MRKALVRNGIVVNIIVVDPGNIPTLDGELVDATGAEIGGTWDGAAFGPRPVDIEAIKSAKIDALSSACGHHITSGFTSAALGASHTYDSDLESQLNLSGAVTLAEPIPYTCTDASGLKTARNHTAAQMRQVFVDGVQVKINALARFRSLRDQVLAAATAAEVEAVTW